MNARIVYLFATAKWEDIGITASVMHETCLVVNEVGSAAVSSAHVRRLLGMPPSVTSAAP